MASAGRILIMPKGGWAAETEYEMLDLVAHNGRAWVAKKASVGIEPSEENAEYWHDFLGMDVFTEENPPTAAQVGAVSLYADPVLSKSTDWDNLESGTYRFSTWGGSGGVGYPPIDDVGICILFDTEAGRYMYCLGMNRIVSRYYERKTWSDWIEGYLPLTGGMLSADVLGLGGGWGAVYSSGWNTSIKHCAVPRDEANKVEFLVRDNSASNGTIPLVDVASLKRTINNTPSYYRIFGEHNKPNGSYTGNGSATERTINIGGIGRFLLMDGNGHFTLVGTDGAVCFHPDSNLMEPVSRSKLRFAGGVLYITSVEACANVSGVTYNYQLV